MAIFLAVFFNLVNGGKSLRGFFYIGNSWENFGGGDSVISVIRSECLGNSAIVIIRSKSSIIMVISDRNFLLNLL